MAEVSVRDLTKDFGASRVLHGVTFDVTDGEFVALVGPSGCGKSTLLRMIAGLEEITGGTVEIGGRVVNDVEPKARDVAMVFQNYALYPHMSVRENMGFSLKLRGAPAADLSARVEQAARILGLSDYLDRMPRALSGGQRQRVAMGRAIVRDPAVFLFDEPLSNLDAALRVQMRAEIRALHERLHTTSIFVTHDQVEAMTMADRIVVLRAGRLEQAGPPLSLYDRPANAFVAGFIGSPAMNLIPAELHGGALHLAPGLSVASASRHAGRVTWGIRPEHLALTAEGPGAIPAEVVSVEATGHSTFITASAGALRLTALLTTRPELARGSEIHLKPDPERHHYFDPDTGVRL